MKKQNWILSKNQKDEIVSRYGKGEYGTKLADEYGVTRVAVYNILKTHGVKIRTASECHPTKKISTDKVVEMYNAKMTIYKIGRLLGIADRRVIKILDGAGIQRRSTTDERRRGHTLNEKCFHAPLSPMAIYWLGFLFADGCCFWPKKATHAPRLQVSLAEKDAAHLEKLRSFVGATHTVKHYTTKKGHRVAVFTVSSRVMGERLRELGLCKKSLLRRTPEEIEDCKDFYRGLIDGDGGVYFYKRGPSLVLVGGKDIVDEFCAYLHAVLPGCDYKAYPTGSIWTATASGKKAKKLIRGFYEGAALSLDRKMAKAREILDAPEPSVGRPVENLPSRKIIQK